MVIFIAVKGKEKIKSTLHIIFFLEGMVTNPAIWLVLYPVSISAQEPW